MGHERFENKGSVWSDIPMIRSAPNSHAHWEKKRGEVKREYGGI